MTCKRLSVLIQYLAPQRLLTRFAGWLAKRRAEWFKNWQINHLIHRYGANIHEALLTNLSDYPTFNSFFTRLLQPELRPIVSDIDAIASPADGCISQIGHIQDQLLLQAKGFQFTLENLLGGEKNLANQFRNGEFATIYLSPKDYHRVHMPLTGTLRETRFIPGKLFSVNALTAQTVPNLFARNERLVCIFDTAKGPMAVILVGAMLVASINTVWAGTIRAKTITQQIYPETGAGSVKLEKGAELGHFNMGSTVITLFPQGTVQWSSNLQEDSLVKMGQLVGKILNF